jgi:hypothetical protein
MKLEFFGHVFEKRSNVKFHRNLSIESRVVPCGRMTMAKLIFDFRNFTNAVKKVGSKPFAANFSYYIHRYI